MQSRRSLSVGYGKYPLVAQALAGRPSKLRKQLGALNSRVRAVVLSLCARNTQLRVWPELLH
jgi:hypothetical protein